MSDVKSFFACPGFNFGAEFDTVSNRKRHFWKIFPGGGPPIPWALSLLPDPLENEASAVDLVKHRCRKETLVPSVGRKIPKMLPASRILVRERVSEKDFQNAFTQIVLARMNGMEGMREGARRRAGQ
jgi:hypothetical protein